MQFASKFANRSIHASINPSMSQSIVRSVSQTSLGPVIKRCLLSSLVVLPYSYLMMLMMMMIIMGLMMRNGCSNRFNYASATCAIMAPASASATAAATAAGRWAAHQAKREEGRRRCGSIGSDRIFVPVGKLLQTSGKC